MTTLKALSDLSVAGEPVKQGDAFDVDEEHARALVARGLAEHVAEAHKSPTGDTEGEAKSAAADTEAKPKARTAKR